MNFPFKTDSLAKQITLRSAVNPSLWACLVLSLPLFYLSIQVEGWLRFAFFAVALIPVLAFVISYLFFVFRKPDYLRSEEHQIRMESLKLFGDKDNPFHADAEDIVSVINNPMLPPPNGEKHE